jgi:hypothetical protein
MGSSQLVFFASAKAAPAFMLRSLCQLSTGVKGKTSSLSAQSQALRLAPLGLTIGDLKP